MYRVIYMTSAPTFTQTKTGDNARFGIAAYGEAVEFEFERIDDDYTTEWFTFVRINGFESHIAIETKGAGRFETRIEVRPIDGGRVLEARRFVDEGHLNLIMRRAVRRYACR